MAIIAKDGTIEYFNNLLSQNSIIAITFYLHVNNIQIQIQYKKI